MDKYQTVSKRFFAGVIDGLIFLPIGFIDAGIASLEPSKWVWIVWLLISFPIGWIYYVILTARYGQTLGKMAAGIKVLDVNEDRPVTFAQSFLRESVFIGFNTILLAYAVYLTVNDIPRGDEQLTNVDLVVAAWAYLWFFAEIVSALMNPKRRAIHDLIAGTVVVRTEPDNAVAN
jgi:uncharacterized RDD family membrane protein YckC